MSFPSFDDPRQFLADFGVPATCTPNGGQGTAFPVVGIFYDRYGDAKLGTMDVTTAETPVLRCMEYDAGMLKKYDLVKFVNPQTRQLTNYYLEHDARPDGNGHVFLPLALDTDA